MMSVSGKRKPRKNSGFSVAEMLITCLIMALSSGIIVQTLDLAIRQIRLRSADSKAQILCNELAVAVRDQLSYVIGVDTTTNPNPVFRTAANGPTLKDLNCQIQTGVEDKPGKACRCYTITKDGDETTIAFELVGDIDLNQSLKWFTPVETVEYPYNKDENVFNVTVTVTDAENSSNTYEKSFTVSPLWSDEVPEPPGQPLRLKSNYAIVWEHPFLDDNSRIQTNYLEEGDEIHLPDVEPTYSNEMGEYKFIGWATADGVSFQPGTLATGNQTYFAQFKLDESKINLYTVIWENENHDILQEDTHAWAYGATPRYTGATPIKEETPWYTYEFAGWNPTPAPIRGDETYTASFTSSPRKYTITWQYRLSEDGSLVKFASKEVNYGDKTPECPNGTPTRDNYTFVGWTPAYSELVTGTQTYTAVFTPMKYTITWCNEDGTVLETDTNVPYHDNPHYDGTPPTKPNTDQYTYQWNEYNGWTPDLHAVEHDQTYTAKFTEIPLS